MAAGDHEDLVRRTRNLLFPASADASWPDSLITSALRLVLTEYMDQSRVREATVTVRAAGYEQDLSGVARLYRIREVAYPWTDGIPFYQRSRKWREIREHVVVLEDTNLVYEPAAGDEIRVRYTEVHTIEGLDGGTTTTIPVTDQTPLTIGAAGRACGLRAGDLSEAPGVAADAIVTLNERRDAYLRDWERWLSREAAAAGADPSWPRVGLD